MSSCTVITEFCKTDGEVLDYLVEWAAWLSGDSIASDTFIADSGLTVDSDADEGDDRRVWLSGGEVSHKYSVTNQIVTTSGRTAERSFTVKIVRARGD